MKKEIYKKVELNLFDYIFHQLPVIKETKLYKVIKSMPKGILHHIHLPAAASMEAFLDVYTHDKNIYYSPIKKLLKLFIDKEVEEGYVRITEYRQIMGNEEVD